MFPGPDTLESAKKPFVATVLRRRWLTAVDANGHIGWEEDLIAFYPAVVELIGQSLLLVVESRSFAQFGSRRETGDDRLVENR